MTTQSRQFEITGLKHECDVSHIKSLEAGRLGCYAGQTSVFLPHRSVIRLPHLCPRKAEELCKAVIPESSNLSTTFLLDSQEEKPHSMGLSDIQGDDEEGQGQTAD
jgi:hypothetical protein